MTEENKARIVKYWNILRCMMISDYSVIAEHRYSSAEFTRTFAQSIQCAIAEVEAIQTELEHHRVFETHDEYLAQLAELKQLL